MKPPKTIRLAYLGKTQRFSGNGKIYEREVTYPLMRDGSPKWYELDANRKREIITDKRASRLESAYMDRITNP